MDPARHRRSSQAANRQPLAAPHAARRVHSVPHAFLEDAEGDPRVAPVQLQDRCVVELEVGTRLADHHAAEAEVPREELDVAADDEAQPVLGSAHRGA